MNKFKNDQITKFIKLHYLLNQQLNKINHTKRG